MLIVCTDQFVFFVTFLIYTAVQNIMACTQNKNPGIYCALRDAEIRYYFNKDKNTCLAFKFKGCRGNQNNFEERSQCLETCLPRDGGVCSGGKQPYVSSDGKVLTGKDCDSLHCPKGYLCLHGMGFATCCNATIEDYFDDGLSSESCNKFKGKPRAWASYNGEFWEVLAADSCEDISQMCPDGFECAQINPWFAKCCQQPLINCYQKWRGTAWFCNGACKKKEFEISRGKCGDGACCWTGHKKLCSNCKPETF